MKKKIVSIFLCVLLVFGFVSCGTENSVNTTVPEDTDVTLVIEKEDGNKTVFGVGTELDPHFFSQNVGQADIRPISGLGRVKKTIGNCLSSVCGI